MDGLDNMTPNTKNKRKRNRSQDIPIPMHNFIDTQTYTGKGAKQIEDHLWGLDYEDKDKEMCKRIGLESDKDIPSYKQIQRAVGKIRKIWNADTSGKWVPSDEDTPHEDVRYILDVLREVIIHTDGRKTSITNNEATRVARLSKAMPSADPWLVWQVTQLYLVYESKGQNTTALDMFVAFKPWQDYPDNYLKAIDQGIIPSVPLIFWLLASKLLSEEEQAQSYEDGSYSIGQLQLEDALNSKMADDDIETITGITKKRMGGLKEIEKRYLVKRDRNSYEAYEGGTPIIVNPLKADTIKEENNERSHSKEG